MTLNGFGGHLILGVTPEEGGPDGSSSKYPPEFRREAVELVRTSGRPVVDVARSLGVTDSTLHNWLKADRDAGPVPTIRTRCRSRSWRS